MNEKFVPYLEELEGKLQRILSMKPVKPSALPKRMPQEGVYLFSEGDRHLYVGRTRRLKQRIKEHVNILGAPFAFRLAREETGCVAPTYRKKGSRDDLFSRPEFDTALRNAQQRIGNMDVRYVEETDPIRQTLLEVYVAVVLETPHNKFATSQKGGLVARADSRQSWHGGAPKKSPDCVKKTASKAYISIVRRRWNKPQSLFRRGKV